MPASGAISLADANLWLALAFSDHAHHAAARSWFEAQPDGSCAFCRVTQMAILRHLTHGRIMGAFVQTQQEAWRNFDQLLNDPRVVFLPEPENLEAGFRHFTQAAMPSHGGWTDAYLAAFASGHAAQLVTFDRGFSCFPGLDLQVLG